MLVKPAEKTPLKRYRFGKLSERRSAPTAMARLIAGDLRNPIFSAHDYDQKSQLSGLAAARWASPLDFRASRLISSTR